MAPQYQTPMVHNKVPDFFKDNYLRVNLHGESKSVERSEEFSIFMELVVISKSILCSCYMKVMPIYFIHRLTRE